jgi:hypothetical protein
MDSRGPASAQSPDVGRSSGHPLSGHSATAASKRSSAIQRGRRRERAGQPRLKLRIQLPFCRDRRIRAVAHLRHTI